MRAFTLADADRPIECNTARVRVPEFDDPKIPGDECYCYIREMSAHDRDTRVDTWWQTLKEVRKQEDNSGRLPWVAAACLCHEDGRWLAETSLAVADLADKLSKQKATAIERLVNAASTVNAMGKAEVETIAKN